jgi:ketosteroid isomerase-like protein
MPRKWALVGAGVVKLLVASSGSGSCAADDPAAEIRAALEQWRIDFNARRATRICDLFAPDLRYDFRGLPEQNYALLCDRLHRALADKTKSFQYGVRIKEILVSGSLAVVRLERDERKRMRSPRSSSSFLSVIQTSGDSAYSHHALTWISTVTGSEGNSTTNEETGLDVFQRQADGSWKRIRYIAYLANP